MDVTPSWPGTWTDGERLARSEAMLGECHALLRRMLASGRPLPAGIGPEALALLRSHGAMGEEGEGRQALAAA